MRKGYNKRGDSFYDSKGNQFAKIYSNTESVVSAIAFHKVITYKEAYEFAKKTYGEEQLEMRKKYV